MTESELAEIERLAKEPLKSRDDLWKISDAVPALVAEVRRLQAIAAAAKEYKDASVALDLAGNATEALAHWEKLDTARDKLFALLDSKEPG